MLAREPWTALFIDVSLPDGSGLDLLAYARMTGCASPALVLTARHDPVTINRAFDLAANIVIKPGEWHQIDTFVRRALAAEEKLRETAEKWSRVYTLSATETAILVATAEGASRDAVIDDRDIAASTFKRHVGNILGKTGDSSLMHAAARLLREASTR